MAFLKLEEDEASLTCAYIHRHVSPFTGQPKNFFNPESLYVILKVKKDEKKKYKMWRKKKEKWVGKEKKKELGEQNDEEKLGEEDEVKNMKKKKKEERNCLRSCVP